MAWIVRKNVDIAVAPMVRWTPETIDEIMAANAEVVARYSHLPPEDPEYIEQGDAPAGHPIRMPSKPYEAVVEEYQEPLPDAVTQTIVNDRIRSMVEELEPGVHQFRPTVLIMPDGTRRDSWWAMRCCHRVDAVAEEHSVDLYRYSPQIDKHPGQYYYRSNWDSRTKVAIYKDKIRGMSFWYDWRIQLHFFGDELASRMLNEDIRGYSLRPEENLGRPNPVIEV